MLILKEPDSITLLRAAVADRFQLHLPGGYNPIMSRPVGNGLYYWEIGVPFVFESAARNLEPLILRYLGVRVASYTGAWNKDPDLPGARYILWFEVAV